MSFKTVLQKLLLLNSQDKSPVRQRVGLMNQLAFVLGCIGIPYIFIFSSIRPFLGVSAIIFVSLFFVSIFLSHLGYHRLSRFLPILNASAVLFFYTFFLGKEAGVHYVYFAIVAIPFVAFLTIEWMLTMFSILTVMGTYGYLELTHFPISFQIILPASLTTLIRYTSSFVTFIVILMYVYFYHRLREKNECELQTQAKALESQAHNLQQSYTELQDTHERLKESINTIDGMSHKAMLGGILQGIAHELKNPLVNIYSVSDRVLMDKNLDEGMATHMRDIFRFVERATSLMSLMLKDTTTITNTHAAIDVPEMMDQVKRLVRDQAFRDKIQLEFLVAENIPPIKGTEAYVFQALLNLAVNALNHTKAGGKLTIEARDNPDTNHVQISITDTGEGIPEDILPHIFESGVSSKKGVLSAGLGLVFVKRVLDAHHATIHVSSTVGEGSCFTVAFPTLS